MCCQAAELVNRNWEAYEAHMRDVRDYLEATLEVSTSGPSPQSQAAGCGAWSRLDMSLWPCPPPHKDRAAWKHREVHSPLISPGLLWEAEDSLQQSL